MEMVGDAGSGRGSQVEAQVDALGIEHQLEGPHALLGEVHHLVEGLGGRSSRHERWAKGATSVCPLL